MAEITFPYAPGFADVPDSVLMAEKYAMGVHLGRMVENAAMGMVRPEVFVGVYINGQTVSLPVSPVDGYQYSRDELTYMWATHGLHNLDTGWLSYVDKWWFGQWFVNQTSGLVTIEKWYSNDSGSKNQKTNDGILIVYTFATRRKNSMFMSAIPYYSQHADSDVAIDKALHETPLRDTSRNAKFSIVNTEAIYCGTFKSLDKVAPPVSPVDGYQYDTSEITWLWSWVWTTAGDSYVPPVASLLGGNLLTQLHQLRARVDADGTVHTNVVYYFDQPIDMGDNFGRIAVTAICNRSASSVNGYLGDAAGRINIPHAYMNEPFMYANRWSNWKVPDLPADAEIIALVGVMGIEFTQRAGTYKSYPSTYFNPDNLQLSGIGLTSGGYICGPIHDYTTHSGLYATHTSGGADNYRDGGMGKTLATLNTTVAIAQNKGTLQSADGCELKTTSVAIAIIYSTASGPKGNLGTSVFPPDFVLDPAHSCVWAYPQMAQASPLVQGDYIAPLGTVCEASAATFSTVKVPVSDLGLPLSNEFAWIDSQDLAAGKPTRTDLLVQLNKNIREAVMRPEFFDCGDFVHGQTVPLPASPVDGYQYTQPEVIWMWEFKDTGMNLAGNIRLLDWAVSVDPTTGLVTIKEAHIRDGGRIVWDNQGTLCVKAIGVRSAAHSVPSVPADSSDSSGGGGSETESVVPNGGMDNFSGNGQIIADGWWAIDFAGDYSYSEQPGIVPVGSSQGISIGTSGAGNRAGVRNARLPIFAGDRHLLCFKAKSSVAITTGFLARVRFWNSDATDSVYADVVSGPLDTNPISTSLGIQVPKQGDTDLWTGMGMVALSVAPAWTPAWVSLEFHVDSPDVACTVSVDEVDWARATSDLRGIAIDTATDPADGQVLKYDAAAHQYAPADDTGGGGGGDVTAAEIQQQSLVYAEDTGADDAFAITLDPAPTLVSGSLVVMKAAHTNSGSPATLSVNGGAAKAIMRDVSNRLVRGDIGPGDLVPLMYDGTVFQMMRLRSRPYVAPMTIPLISQFTPTNIGACTLTDDPDALWMHIPNTAALNWRLMLQNQPATPYTVICRMYYSEPAANSADVGVYFSDGTKLAGLELLSQSGGRTLRVEKITNVTTDSATVGSIVSPYGISTDADTAVFLRLRNDGTTLYFDYSTDYTAHWVNLATLLISAWLNPTKIGFGGVCVTSSGANAVDIHVSGWNVSAGAGF